MFNPHCLLAGGIANEFFYCKFLRTNRWSFELSDGPAKDIKIVIYCKI